MNVKLPKTNTAMAVTTKSTATTTTKLDVRCYNCNSLGHYAVDCGKPRRQPGTCYACGSKDHMVSNCSLNKKKQSETNYYVRYFLFRLHNKPNFSFSLECLIDSGSPVSLIKEDMVPNEFQILNFDNNTSFYGLNFTELKTIGKCLCLIEVNKCCYEIELIVVDAKSMKYSILLGRDFLNITNSKIMIGESEKENKVHKLQNEFDLDENTEFEKAIMALENYTDKNDINLNVQENVPHEVKSTLEKIFRNTYVNLERPEEPEIKFEMKINLDNLKPFNCPPRRLAYAEKQALQKIIDELLENKIIRVSESEYTSPIVLVRKKTGELRMCVDFRHLNKMTMKHNYPIPLIDDLLETLCKKTIFTKLDLRNGFYHVHMHEESVKFTSFITPLGQFEFLRMPFGLKNAPSVFQMFINKIFADLVKDRKVIIYLDDIMIATDNIPEHLSVLEEVMKRIVKKQIRVATI